MPSRPFLGAAELRREQLRVRGVRLELITEAPLWILVHFSKDFEGI